MSDRAHKAKMAKYEALVERLYKLHFEHLLAQGDVIGELRARIEAMEKDMAIVKAKIETITKWLSPVPTKGKRPILNPQDMDSDNP